LCAAPFPAFGFQTKLRILLYIYYQKLSAMKIQITVLFFAVLFISGSCGISSHNYFEGIVSYQHKIITKDPNFSIAKLEQFFGTGSILTFKEGNFAHMYSESIMKRDVYRRKENKFYFSTMSSDTTYWLDCGKKGDEILKFSFTPKKEKILGIICDELIIQYKNKTVKDYYNSSTLTTNPEWFAQYTLDGENIIDLKEKAIYLKRKVVYPEFTLVSTATSFTRTQVSDEVFTIPADAILVEQQ
jgi:hypothetical protein